MSQDTSGRLRFGVLGLNRGSWFIRAMPATQHAVCAGWCTSQQDLAKKRAASMGDFPLFTSFDDMLASDIDAVVIASPPQCHVEHTLKALDAGKHVLAEVPAATSIDDCRRLIRAVEQAKTQYMLAENFCYMWPWLIVRSLLADKLLGDIYFARGELIFQPGFGGPDTGDWKTDAWAMRQGHPYATHHLGPILEAMAEPIHRIVCMGSGQHHQTWAAADDTACVLCNTTSGKLIELRMDFFSRRPSSGIIELQGTKGTVEMSTTPAGQQRVYFAGNEAGAWQDLREFSDRLPASYGSVPDLYKGRLFDSGLPLMMDDFASAALQNRRPPLDVYHGVNLTLPGLSSEISRQRGGEPVAVPTATAL